MFGAMNAMRQSRMQGLQLQQAEQEQADHDALNQALQNAPKGANGRPDYGAVATMLERGGNARAGQKIRAFEAEQRNKELDASKKLLEVQNLRFDDIDRRGGLAFNALAVAEKDPSQWRQVR